MPRRVTCEVQFRRLVQHSLHLVNAGETARTALIGGVHSNLLHFRRLELLYESAYLRAFAAWEEFLEASFLRYLCGYRNGAGTIPLNVGVYHRTLSAAFADVSHGRPFVLWHDASKVVQRSRAYFSNGPHEVVIASHLAQLENYGVVRHRIAHAHQDDAQRKFDVATRALVGKKVHGSRAGNFLREFVPRSAPPNRWMEQILRELVQLAVQVEA